MCGIAVLAGPGWPRETLGSMVDALHHRGPDARGQAWLAGGCVGLGHTRLQVVDCSPAGAQPMTTPDGRFTLVFNGEIYNAPELGRAIPGFAPRGHSDTEVLLAAWAAWGEAALPRLIGMFAFAVWDEVAGTLTAVRDRFGVKPLLMAELPGGRIALASEVGALRAAGAARAPDAATWATYLAGGLTDHSGATYWEGVRAVPPGHLVRWRGGPPAQHRWYDVAEATGAELDRRAEGEVAEEYLALLREATALRLRSDVSVGVAASGGLDSSLLLSLTSAALTGQRLTGFTFVTGHPEYDELPWARELADATGHPIHPCALHPGDVPALAADVARCLEEPYGGVPTLAYARVFEEAHAAGVTVILDGQGMDEQWAGYDYYRRPAGEGEVPVVQATRSPVAVPGALLPEFRALARPFEAPAPFGDALRDTQYRDIRYTKLPRALRYSDRVSMRVSTELREPFLDHRLVELALRQPAERKLDLTAGTGKRMLRQLAAGVVPPGLAQAPKRAVQTPQREWLRGPLAGWADAQIELALAGPGGSWLDAPQVRGHWRRYRDGAGDNSHAVWQWIGLGLLTAQATAPPRTPAAMRALA